jgi:hypothetical protein
LYIKKLGADMDITEIRSAIVSGQFSVTELETLAQALKFARNQLSRRNTFAFRSGDTVKFTNPKTGVTFRGSVDRVKQKYVLVATPQGRYNVPASLLESA